MSKKYIPLLIFLIFLLGFIIVIGSNNTTNKQNINNAVTVTTPLDHSVLRLTPQEVWPDSQGNVLMSVLLDNRTVNVSSVQFTLFYDPTSLQVVDIQPQGIFKDGQVTQRNIHDKGSRCCQEIGKITYGLQIDPGKSTTLVSESNPVVNISFKVLDPRRLTEVRFLEASINSQNITDAVIKEGYNTVVKFPNVSSFDLYN